VGDEVDGFATSASGGVTGAAVASGNATGGGSTSGGVTGGGAAGGDVPGGGGASGDVIGGGGASGDVTGGGPACEDVTGGGAASGDVPGGRAAGRREAAGAAASDGVTEGHDVPPDVLNGVVHWLVKGQYDPVTELDGFRRRALVGARWCRNDGCEVVGHLKDFKVCPQCKTSRYCGDVCQKQDWTTGGHKETCGTSAASKPFTKCSIASVHQ